MAIRKDGKKASDIFAATTGGKPAGKPAKKMGRPSTLGGEQTAKFTALLLSRHVVFMQRFGAATLEKVGARVQGAELLRALLDALADSAVDVTRSVDLSNPQTREANLREFFTSKLKK